MISRHCLCSALVGLLSLLFLPAAAAEDAQKGLQIQPHDPFLVSMRAALNSRAPSTDEMQKLSAYIEKHPHDSAGHLVLSKAYNRLGMDGMYAEELEKVWRFSPDSLLYLFAALKARAATDDHAGFDRLVDEAFQTYKNDAKMLTKVGEIFQNNNQSVLATSFLKRAVELEPKDLPVLCSYCNSLLALKQYRELLSATEPLLSSEKTRALAHLLRGVAWYKLNQSQKAVPLLAEAFREAPEQAEVAEAYVDALIATGKKSQALQPALVALSLQPPFGAHLDVVKTKIKPLVARASSHDLEVCKIQIARSMPAGRSLAFFYFALGDLLDKSGRVLAAAQCFSEGLTLDNSFGRAYMRLAHDMELLGLAPDQIMDLYKRAALMTGDDAEVVAKYERMKTRLPGIDRDIAAKMKTLINNVRYKS